MSVIEDQELVNLVVECHQESSRAFTEQTAIESPFPGARGAIIENPWPIYQEMYEGKQWARMGRMPGWKSTPKDDIIFRTCESYTTFITDNRSKAQFLPADTEDAELSNKVQAVWNQWCSWVSIDVQQSMAVLDSRKFGIGWLHLKRDKECNALGQSLEIVNPDSIKVDPDHTVDKMLSGKEPTYLIHEHLTQLGELMQTFPKVDWDRFDPRWMPRGSLGMWDRVLKWVDRANGNVKSPAIAVPVYHLWLRDTSEIVWEEELGDSLSAVLKKKKYPGGRHIVVAGGVLLLDEPNPYDHGQIPFTPIFAYPESGKFYCAGDIQNLIAPQVQINRTHQLLYDSTTKSGGGILLVDPKQITADMVSNDPFQIIEAPRVNEAMRFEQFPPAARHLFTYLDTLKQAGMDAAGIHELSQGMVVPGNRTAQEVAGIMESDKTRARKAARILAWSNQRLAEQWFSNAAQWSDWEVFCRIADAEGKETNVTLNGDELKKCDDSGELTKDALDFDITVVDTSTLPTYYQEQKQLALDLFDRQVIDPEALLEVLEFPGWRAIVARMKGQASAEAEKSQPTDPSAQGMPPAADPMAAMAAMSGQMPMQNQPMPMQMLPMMPDMGQMQPGMGQMPPDMGAEQPDELDQLTSAMPIPPELLAVLAAGGGTGA